MTVRCESLLACPPRHLLYPDQEMAGGTALLDALRCEEELYMGDSLKEQLIALGLAKPGGDRKPKAGRKPAVRRKPQKRDRGQLSLDEAYRLRQREEKRSAAEKKARKRAEDILRRQINAKVQGIVEAHALNDKAAELKRSFLYKGRIRSVLVTPEQLAALNAGELGVVFLRGSYFVMLPEHVESVREISADHVPELGSGGDETDEEGEFPVPDDLVW